MRLAKITPQQDYLLHILTEDGRQGLFDLSPYLDAELFQPLRNPEAFSRISNGGYFIEWESGADLSADTIEAHWQEIEPALAKAS